MIERMLPFIIPGLLYGIGAVGLSLSLRFLRFPDFTTAGSIVVAGIACIAITPVIGPWGGIIVGAAAGGALGLLTGLLVQYLRVQPVLAGIVAFTASHSVGYLIAADGTISLPDTATSLVSPSFSTVDAAAILSFVLATCLILAITMRMKIGSLVLAMTGSRRFLRFRHRYQTVVFIGVLIVSNFLVGVAGAIFALKERNAFVASHMDFLPLALGAIFGGNAVISWLSRRSGKVGKVLWVMGPDIDFSRRVGFLLISYCAGSIFLSEIQGLVFSNAFTLIHPALSVPSNLQYLATAIAIAAFVWWASWEEEDD